MMLSSLRIWRRKFNMLALDLFMLYNGVYMWTLGYVIPFHLYWKDYEHLAFRMIGNQVEINPQELYDFSNLEEWKCYLYHYEPML